MIRAKGDKGDTGVGIDEVQFLNYELTFVMTDENAIQLGNIRGAKKVIRVNTGQYQLLALPLKAI